MDVPFLIRCLRRHVELLVAAFEALPDDELRFRPAPGKWSALEILGHLVDEERGDFRVRLESTLRDPEAAWPPIDPEGWVRARKHQERVPAELLAELRAERAASLAWLAGLGDPDWGRAHVHPQLGALRAGDLLLSWAAHDLLHLRQLANTRLAALRAHGAPFSHAYAGA